MLNTVPILLLLVLGLWHMFALYILTEEVRRVLITSRFYLDFIWLILHNDCFCALRLSDNFCGIHLCLISLEGKYVEGKFYLVHGYNSQFWAEMCQCPLLGPHLLLSHFPFAEQQCLKSRCWHATLKWWALTVNPNCLILSFWASEGE